MTNLKPMPPSLAAAAAAVLAALRLDDAIALSFGFSGRRPQQSQIQPRYVDTALPSAVAAPVETSPGAAAAGLNGVLDGGFDVDYIADALLESSAPSFHFQQVNGAPSPNSGVADWLNNGAAGASSPNNAGVADDWPASNIYDDWNVDVANGEQGQPDIRPSDDHLDRFVGSPIRAVMTGRDRRASWESYAAVGAPARRGATGGEIGSPGGAGDWRFATSYGPATTSSAPSGRPGASSASSSTSASGSTANASYSAYSAAPSNMIGTFSAPTSASNNAHNSVSNPANGSGPKQHGSRVMTGSERRATFGSFDPFAPAHEARGAGKKVGSTFGAFDPFAPAHEARGAGRVVAEPRVPVKSNAERVVETLSALPETVEAPVEEDVSPAQEVPMDTPARRSLPPHLSLRPIPGKGLGVITNKPMSKGEFVGNYEGEIMTEEVKDRRYLSSLHYTLTEEDREWIQSRLDRGQTLTGCYLYGVSLDDDNIYQRFGRKGGDAEGEKAAPKRIFVDAEDEYHSLWTRFINHASPPNNNVNPKSVPESYDGNPRVWFMANRDIEAGEELCFDYGEDYWLDGDVVY